MDTASVPIMRMRKSQYVCLGVSPDSTIRSVSDRLCRASSVISFRILVRCHFTCVRHYTCQKENTILSFSGNLLNLGDVRGEPVSGVLVLMVVEKPRARALPRSHLVHHGEPFRHVKCNILVRPEVLVSCVWAASIKREVPPPSDWLASTSIRSPFSVCWEIGRY